MIWGDFWSFDRKTLLDDEAKAQKFDFSEKSAFRNEMSEWNVHISKDHMVILCFILGLYM